MPIIPMRQKVTIHKYNSKTTDGWGGKLAGESITVKCRFVESQKLLKTTAGLKDVRDTKGKEVISKGVFHFDKFIDLSLLDTLEYTNELGVTHTYTPISIDVIRHINTKAIATKVEVS